MANEEQLSILRQGVEVWNEWRKKHFGAYIELDDVNLGGASLVGANLNGVSLSGANLSAADLSDANLSAATLGATNLSGARPDRANLSAANLWGANLDETHLSATNLNAADISQCSFLGARLDSTIWGEIDLSEAVGLEHAIHLAPSTISTNTFILSRGKIPQIFLKGCGLSDWEIETVKLYNTDLSNEEINNIQYKTYDLRATRALQISPLFISYGHEDSEFVDKIENQLNLRGIRFWRDIHDMKSGRMEKQIDRALRQNPTVLLILSENSLSSDWVEHEVRAARELEKEMGRDVMCPIALDDTWKSSRWPKRIMEQIMEYNILDFSKWEDDSKFDAMFRKLIDGLELFYKG